MAVTVKTTTQALFWSGDKYFLEAYLDYTINTSQRTITVSLTGIRSYCASRYNFTQEITTWLNSSNSSSGATVRTGNIARSGSNDYTGWLPRSGNYTACNMSRTFSYDSNGNPPNIYFYLQAKRNNVYHLDTGEAVNAFVSTSPTPNLKGTFNLSNIGPLGPTKVTLTRTAYDATSISWFASADSNVTDYRVYVNGGLAATGTTTGISRSGTTTVSSRQNTLYVMMKYNNSSWVTSNTITADCTLPSANNLTVTPTSTNAGTLSFSSNYNVQYNFNGTTGTLSVGNTANVKVNLNNNTVSTYTLQLTRTDNNRISNSFNVTVDSRLATLNLSVNGDYYNCTANLQCYNWSYLIWNPQTTETITGGPYANLTTSINFRMPNLAPGTWYMQVSAITYSSKLRATSNTVMFNIAGTQIYDGNNFRPVTPYVFNGTEWQEVVPYVFISNTGTEDDWRICN